MLGRERDLDGHSSFGDEEVETDAHKKDISVEYERRRRGRRDSFTGDVHAGNVVVVVVVVEYS